MVEHLIVSPSTITTYSTLLLHRMSMYQPVFLIEIISGAGQGPGPLLNDIISCGGLVRVQDLTSDTLLCPQTLHLTAYRVQHVVLSLCVTAKLPKG